MAGWELFQSEGLGSREAPGASEPGRVQCRALPRAANGNRVSLQKEASLPSAASDECDERHLHTNLTYVAFATDDEELQEQLPNILIGNESTFPARTFEALYQAPPDFFL